MNLTMKDQQCSGYIMFSLLKRRALFFNNIVFMGTYKETRGGLGLGVCPPVLGLYLGKRSSLNDDPGSSHLPLRTVV